MYKNLGSIPLFKWLCSSWILIFPNVEKCKEWEIKSSNMDFTKSTKLHAQDHMRISIEELKCHDFDMFAIKPMARQWIVTELIACLVHAVGIGIYGTVKNLEGKRQLQYEHTNKPGPAVGLESSIV